MAALQQCSFDRFGCFGAAEWNADSETRPEVGKVIDWRANHGALPHCCAVSDFVALLDDYADRIAAARAPNGVVNAALDELKGPARDPSTLPGRLRALGPAIHTLWPGGRPCGAPCNGDGEDLLSKAELCAGGRLAVLCHLDLAPKNIMVDPATGLFTA